MAALSGPKNQSGGVVCFATQGSGSGDERRIVELLAPLAPTLLVFDRGAKRRMAVRLLREFRRRRPALVVMEGTGLAGGAPLLLAHRWFGTRFVVSCGDPVAPYVAAFHPWLRPFAHLYERLLYRRSAGVIGWSPYIVGRAISMGAPRAATAANWCVGSASENARDIVRQRLGIPADALVFGIVGSLDLTPRLDWCYGSELVRALKLTERSDLRVLIVGDGSGRARVEELAGDDLGRRVLLAGRCAPEDVLDYLAAMDVASLPQTVDSAGALRYTSKLSEYVAAGVPVVTGQLPLAYDLDDDGWMWRMPGDAPWQTEYLAALAALMSGLTADELAEHRAAVPTGLVLFDRKAQQRRVVALVQDIIGAGS
jgi:glycosyltransferase involved in cell wall biosynthesis